MKVLYIFLLTTLLLARCQSGDLVGIIERLLGAPETVSSVELSAYLGKWHQVYSSAVQTISFEKNAICQQAVYTAMPNNQIGVNNSQLDKTTHKPSSILGYAYFSNQNEPGQLDVKFYHGGLPFAAPYWILKLGPIVNGQYQWSIVSDPLRINLFVLARDPSEFFAANNDEVSQLLVDLGFTYFWNKPIQVYQGPICDSL